VDVFRTSEGPSPAGEAALERLFDGAALLGLELDPRWRVLAVTIAPRASHHPSPSCEDDRVQILFHPVSTVLASLRRRAGDDRQLLAFEADQLLDVVSALAGSEIRGPVLGRLEPRPGAWGPRFSLEGRSNAPDGTSRTLTLEVADDEVELGFFARFDSIDVKDATGRDLLSVT
jgi:hypothetical protein